MKGISRGLLVIEACSLVISLQAWRLCSSPGGGGATGYWEISAGLLAEAERILCSRQTRHRMRNR